MKNVGLRILPALLFLLPLMPAIAPMPAVTQMLPVAQIPAPVLPPLESAKGLGAEMFAQSGRTGMVLVVVRGNEVFFSGYGETAPGSQQVPAQESVLRLCSLTKIFTADVLARLVADRTVRLDDPLQRFAPARTVVPTKELPITLEDLATHTSGLPRELGHPARGTPHFTYPDYRTRWRWLPNQRLRSIPGRAALYSNVAFDLLSDALQSATHQQYAALLAERTLNPLHMRNTTFFPSAAQCGLLLVSTGDQGPCTTTEETAGSSGLYSNANDMAIWLKYLLRTGGAGMPAQDPVAQDVYVVPSKLASEIGLDHAGKPTGVGLGWIHILPADDLSHIIEKTGGGAGFETYIAINHARQTAIFVASTYGAGETQANPFYLANNLLLQMAGLPPTPPPPPKPVAKRGRSSRHRQRSSR